MSSVRFSARPASCRSLEASELGDVAGPVEHRLGDIPDGRSGLLGLPQLGDEVVEALDRLGRAGRQPGHVLRPGQRGGEGDPVPRGEPGHVLQGAVADAAPRHVDHPPQRDLVGRVGDQPQVGQQVPDLPALVEPHAADHLVRQPGPDEDFLEDPGLGVGPVEHGDVARGRVTRVGELVDLLGHERGLVVLAVRHVADQRRPVARRRTTGSSASARCCGRRRHWRRPGCSGWTGSSARAGSPARRGSRARTR